MLSILCFFILYFLAIPHVLELRGWNIFDDLSSWHIEGKHVAFIVIGNIWLHLHIARTFLFETLLLYRGPEDLPDEDSEDEEEQEGEEEELLPHDE